MEGVFLFILTYVLSIMIVTILSIYDNYKLSKQIKDKDSKMFKMFHPQSEQYVRVLKSETEMIDNMLKMGWSIVEDKK
jgi:hypothetical protein